MIRINNNITKNQSKISGEQKQRTAAARAIVHEPAIILADEPTGALDSKNATSLLNAMKGLNEEQDKSILLVTHDSMSASHCKRILFIRDGEIYREIHRNSTREVFH